MNPCEVTIEPVEGAAPGVGSGDGVEDGRSVVAVEAVVRVGVADDLGRDLHAGHSLAKLFDLGRGDPFIEVTVESRATVSRASEPAR